MMVVVGLGNPGRNYARTRHNAGAQCVESLASAWSIPLDRRSRHALHGEGSIDDQEVVLARPRTYMNHSGEAAKYLVDRFRIAPSRLLVLYDDMDLQLGSIRLRPGGSAGGQKGVASIIQALGTLDFPRIRVGIGRPPTGVDGVIYVLEGLTPPEEEVMREVRQQVTQAVRSILTGGLDVAMNHFNKRGSGSQAPASS
jgi:PTH1 family peptidyl-tRNA hydrolase